MVFLVRLGFASVAVSALALGVRFGFSSAVVDSSVASVSDGSAGAGASVWFRFGGAATGASPGTRVSVMWQVRFLILATRPRARVETSGIGNTLNVAIRTHPCAGRQT